MDKPYTEQDHKELKEKLVQVFQYCKEFNMNPEVLERINRDLKNIIVTAAWEVL